MRIGLMLLLIGLSIMVADLIIGISQAKSLDEWKYDWSVLIVFSLFFIGFILAVIGIVTLAVVK